MKLFIKIILITTLNSSCLVKNNIVKVEYDYLEVKSHPDPSIDSLINKYKLGLDSVMSEVITYAGVDMLKAKPESVIGNFMTDLCLNYYDSIADFCVLNNGGIRSDLYAGNITKGMIYQLMPFDNQMVILYLNYQELNKLFAYISSRNGEPFSGFYLSIDSLNQYTYKFEKQISNKDSLYALLTTDYLANGGDNMWFLDGENKTFQNGLRQDLNMKLRDLILYHCQKSDTIYSQIDNRILYE